MPRKGIAPRLHSSTITSNGIIGRGQKYYSPSVVWRAEVSEKSGKKFSAAAKTIGEGTPFQLRHSFLNHQKAWKAFKKAGLPVPTFSKLMLKKDNPYYLSVFMEDLEKKYGPLRDIHIEGYPKRLSELTAKNNSTLIRDLASDLATIHKLGFSTEFIDFWHFYITPNGKTNRVILDFNDFYKAKHPQDTRIKANENIRMIKYYFGKKEFYIFYKEYLRNLRK